MLAAKTTYDVRIPDLQPARAEVAADTTATLLAGGGPQIPEATARTTWKDQTLGFDAKIREQKRTLAASGDVVLHPDHQEVHLRDLAMTTEGVEWRTEPGSEAAIQYGGDRVAVEDVRLVSGAQRLAVDGAFGGPGDTLKVRAEAVDIASVNALMLGTAADRRHAERQRHADGHTRGAARRCDVLDHERLVPRVPYQSFEGTIAYAVDGVRLDTRLSQTPDAWIAAKGFVPAAFFKARMRRRPPPGGPTSTCGAAGEELDVSVTSSALSLGLIAGFVPQVTKVSGTLQADVRVTGSPEDPHLNGAIDIRNGAFTVAELTKSGYTGLDTRITLAPDRVRIEEFSLLDEHQHTLRVSGELAVHQRQIGGVQIAMQSDQFEIIDNQLADIKLNTDVRVTGELRQPRVEGTLAVHTGTIDVGRVLAMTTSNAYAVEPTKLETEAPGAVPPSGAAAGAPSASHGRARGPGRRPPPPHRRLRSQRRLRTQAQAAAGRRSRRPLPASSTRWRSTSGSRCPTTS